MLMKLTGTHQAGRSTFILEINHGYAVARLLLTCRSFLQTPFLGEHGGDLITAAR